MTRNAPAGKGRRTPMAWGHDGGHGSKRLIQGHGPLLVFRTYAVSSRFTLHRSRRRMAMRPRACPSMEPPPGIACCQRGTIACASWRHADCTRDDASCKDPMAPCGCAEPQGRACPVPPVWTPRPGPLRTARPTTRSTARHDAAVTLGCQVAWRWRPSSSSGAESKAWARQRVGWRG